MSDLREIRSFVAIDEDLATAGQPTEEQLGLLKAQGFEVVVNLGLLDPAYCLPDEAGTAKALGMSYYHIPVDFKRPTISDFESFERVMRETHHRKVFVHCAANFRVSCFVALFGETVLSWTRQQADAHIRKLWEPNEIWAQFLSQVRAKRQGDASHGQ